jgi:saccharopine dehydrogenase (NAD+, L-lysine-forming)
MAMTADIEKAESAYELVDVLADYTADIFVDRTWRQATYKDTKKIDFGSLFGTRTCYPIQMEEMYAMSEMFSLKETGVYVAGFNWFVDYLVFPLAMIMPRIKKGLGRHLIATLLVYGLRTFSGTAKGVSFVLEADGTRDKSPLKFRIMAEHEDAYAFTAIAIVACVRQCLGGRIAAPGLHLMGHVVEPVLLMKDMEMMGIKITETRRFA